MTDLERELLAALKESVDYFHEGPEDKEDFDRWRAVIAKAEAA